MEPLTAKSSFSFATRSIAVVLIWTSIVPPAFGGGVPPLPGKYLKNLDPVTSGTLPTGATIVTGISSITPDQATNQLTITQNQAKAIIDWQSFNIAANGAVHFSQKNSEGVAQTSWSALNRIHSQDASQILGKLTADGKVYLINQNGILFGQGAQVNVHALSASTLNIYNSEFLAGLNRYRAGAYGAQSGIISPDAAVVNHGIITAGSGGSVYLVAPRIENGGTITAPIGVINLVAVGGGTTLAADGEVEIAALVESGSADVIYDVTASPGSAVNLAGGRLSADSGRVGMYGGTVEQNGVIRSVVAVKKGSEIFLEARDSVRTGAGSITETPVSDSTEKVNQTFSYSPGSITVRGLDVRTAAGGSTEQLPLQEIVHQGAMTAPSGSVVLNAVEQVYLENDSTIDVAGLWLDRPASDNSLEVSLNSVQLADEFKQKQKDGILLGEKVKVDLLTGSAIGDIDSYYTGREMTAQQRSTTGGTVTIGAPALINSGTGTFYSLDRLIMKQGAVIDFSGGGTRYGAGTLETSWLSSGGKLYAISTAPDTLTYDGIHTVAGYVTARTVGSSAGSLNVEAHTVVLNGALDGSVTRGNYQTAVTAHTKDDHGAYDISVARGLEEPTGGSLRIGRDPGGRDVASAETLVVDAVTQSITLQKSVTPLDTDFSADDTLAQEGTFLSTDLLNRAGLSTLELYANTTFTSSVGSALSLLPGGSFSAKARSIEQWGSLLIPGGSATFMLHDTITTHPSLYNNATGAVDLVNTRYVDLEPMLYFAPGSVVSVAGEQVDNSGGTVRTGHTTGGTITIDDVTLAGGTTGNSLVIGGGALLDVSGGYTISPAWKVSGGDGGTLELRAMNLELGGELRGLALAGKKGGQLKLHAGSFLVGANDAAPPVGVTLLTEEMLRDTGFTRIALYGVNDVTLGAGALLGPSLARLATPTPGGIGGSLVDTEGVEFTKEYLGATSVTVTAGTPLFSGATLNPEVTVTANTDVRITVDADAAITTVPGGSISLTAPHLTTAGDLESPGGTISLTATAGDLVVSDGIISAAGYLKPVTTLVGGLAAGDEPQSAGTISLEASRGGIQVGEAAVIDVSGTAPVTRYITNGAGQPERVTVAGDPGTVNLTFATELRRDGTLTGVSRYAGVKGGTLNIKKNNTTSASLKLPIADLLAYQSGGFDALSITSPNGVEFTGGSSRSLTLKFDRSLTLDTPLITGSDLDQLTLSAPWLRRTNSSSNVPTTLTGTASAGALTLAGDWLDLEGSTAISGFDQVTLAAERDLRLIDRTYPLGGKSVWQGSFVTDGNLTLTGARIYPTTLTGFTIKAAGTVTTTSSGYEDSTPIYSAGGSLTIEGSGINHQGYLAAPLGTIALTAVNDGRVYLSSDSVTTVAGEAAVAYGSFDGTYWTTKDVDNASNTTTRPKVTGAPEKAITLTGGEVLVSEGATLDLSGGGSVFTYLFQPGLEGTVNPIATSVTGRSDRYVIVPDNSVQLPGYTYTDASGKSRTVGAVYLNGITLDDGTYLKPGVYSLLPEEYAFLPGALIISSLGKTVGSTTHLRTAEGYQVVGGYSTALGTKVQSSVLTGYVVRSAAKVREEGEIVELTPLVAGEAGTLKATADTMIMAGAYRFNALTGYDLGTLILGGRNILVQNSAPDLPGDFDFSTDLSGFTNLTGKLYLDGDDLAKSGVGTLKLGGDATRTVTVTTGSELAAKNITLAATDAITVEAGAQVNGVSDAGGSVTLASPTGVITVEQGATVHGGTGVTLDANDVNLSGELSSDNNSLNLTANSIRFVDSGVEKGEGETGLYLTEQLWQKFSTFKDISLTSRSDLSFLRETTLSVAGNLTLDAGQIVGPALVKVTADTATLQNSSGITGTVVAADSGSLALNARQITITQDTTVNGFKKVDLTASGDITLVGEGSLQTGGDLNLTGARVTTAARDTASAYTPADFRIGAATGSITVSNSGGVAGTAVSTGGSLTMEAQNISLLSRVVEHPGSVSTVDGGGTLDVAGGVITLHASSGTVLVQDGARIAATGFARSTADPTTKVYLDGGRVNLTSDGGAVTLAAGSRVDVSAKYAGSEATAPANWNAGTISLAAAKGGVTVAEGVLNGTATHGQGGSLMLDSATLTGVDGLDGMATRLANGGFNDTISIRSRGGDATLASTKRLAGRDVSLAIDGGSLAVEGTVTADGVDGGGRVELSAGNRLTLGEKAVISAQGTGVNANGGQVLLSSADGADGTTVFNGKYALQVHENARINVAGIGEGSGGTVKFRAYQGKRQAADTGFNDINMAALGAETIVGADRVSIEGARRYEVKNGSVGAATGYTNDAVNFMKAAATNGAVETNWLKTRLFGTAATDSSRHLQAGIELTGRVTEFNSTGKLNVDTAWDLTSIRPGGEAGVLTLRAENNLTINGNLVDHPTTRTALTSESMKDSWAVTLVAGADLTGSATTALTSAAAGKDLVISDGKLVYTEQGDITVAAANDLKIGKGTVSKYMINDTIAATLASYGGTIRGTVGHDLLFTGAGSIQTAVGDIDLQVGHDLNLGQNAGFGSIRTTGEYAAGETVETGPGSGITRLALMTDYWTYRNGGDISLEVGGDLAGFVNNEDSTQAGKGNGWDYVYGGGTNVANKKNKRVSASFEGLDSTEGIATMGGGDIDIAAAGTVSSQIGAFGTDNLAYSGSGDLSIKAGGDISGRFRVVDGAATLVSGGSLVSGGTVGVDNGPVFEIANTQLSVTALGDVLIGSIINPDNTRTNAFEGLTSGTWNLTYTPDASVSVTSLTGDVTLTGVNGFDAYNDTIYIAQRTILPGTVTLRAGGNLLLDNDFTLAPDTDGNLALYAAAAIDGGYGSNSKSRLIMSDMDPDQVYGYQTVAINLNSKELKDKDVIHREDEVPVMVSAGTDISDLQLFVPKSATVVAGNDIHGLVFSGQNIATDDVTTILAGHDIIYDYLLGAVAGGNYSAEDLGIQLAGPGALMVQAGNNIDLGNSQGIKTTGNSLSPLLTGDKGGDLYVIAGAKRAMNVDDATAFFHGVDGDSTHEDNSQNGLLDAGNDFNELKISGEPEDVWKKRVEEARTGIIRPWFAEYTKGDTTGTITMTSSQISTLAGDDDIYVLARGGVNVGKTAFVSEAERKNTGIFTSSGGAINLYAGGDINVNESRVMTFYGGDITLWSDKGDINAGRGSSTEVSATPPQYTYDNNGNISGVSFPAPAVGSGLRALTYDKDGLGGPQTPPEMGIVYGYTPDGKVDAGEAGIAGGRVVLGALEVLNAKNIVSVSTSVGVPSGGDAGAGIGALSGSGGVTDNNRLIEQTALGADKDKTVRTAVQVMDDFMAKYLDVRVIGFDYDPTGETDERDKEREKSKE